MVAHRSLGALAGILAAVSALAAGHAPGPIGTGGGPVIQPSAAGQRALNLNLAQADGVQVAHPKGIRHARDPRGGWGAKTRSGAFMGRPNPKPRGFRRRVFARGGIPTAI